MNRNLIFYTVISVIITLFLSMMGLMYVKKFYPEYLGFPPLPIDSTAKKRDTVILAQTYEITKEKLDELHKEIATNESLKRKSDSLKSLIQKLNKQNKEKINQIAFLQDSVIPKKEKEIKSSTTLSKILEDSLNKALKIKERSEKDAKIAKTKQKELEEFLVKEVDSLETESFQAFAKIYNNSEPASVAKILEKMPEEKAAQILNFMRKKNAGKVIDAMDPQKAALILLFYKQK